MKKIAILLSALLLGGCYSISAKIASTGLPNSKYRPIMVSESDVDTWVEAIRLVDKKVATDELGTYYHDVRADGIYGAFIASQDGTLLKNLFSGDVGLLEPIYSYDDALELRPDWAETERRYDYLTKTIKLKLLPLQTTRKYHQLVDEKVRSAASRGQAYSISDAFSGNMGLYGPSFYPDIIQKIPGKFSYFVSSAGGAGAYYGSVAGNIQRQQAYQASLQDTERREYMRKRGQDLKKMDEDAKRSLTLTNSPMAYRGTAQAIRAGNPIVFGLVETYRELKSGGAAAMVMGSGCGFHSPEDQKANIRNIKASTDIPYASAINMAIKERNAEELSKAREQFLLARKESAGLAKKHEIACLGLRSIGVAGAISSQKLD